MAGESIIHMLQRRHHMTRDVEISSCLKCHLDHFFYFFVSNVRFCVIYNVPFSAKVS